MKQISKIIFIAILIISSLTACDMGVIQTDKSLRDVLIDKTWKDVLEKEPSENAVIYYKFRNDGRLLAGKQDANCSLSDADTIMDIIWYNEENSKFVWIMKAGYFIDTITFNVEKYSEKTLLGTSENTISEDVEAKQFEFEICE